MILGFPASRAMQIKTLLFEEKKLVNPWNMLQLPQTDMKKDKQSK